MPAPDPPELVAPPQLAERFAAAAASSKPGPPQDVPVTADPSHPRPAKAPLIPAMAPADDGPPPSRAALPLDPTMAAAAAVRPAAATADAKPSTKAPHPRPVMMMQIMFEPDATALPDAARHDLDRIVGAVTADEQRQIRLLTYADPGADGGLRDALSRARGIRDYLIGKGVPGNQLEVRAVDDHGANAPHDRVDLIVGDP